MEQMQKRRRYDVETNGFVGELYPVQNAKLAMIVLSDPLTGYPLATNIAKAISINDVTALAVNLWGARGQITYPDRISGNAIESAVRSLKVIPGIEMIGIYAAGLTTPFAVIAATQISDIRACALISPVWGVYEGILNRGEMSGHSAIMWNGQELPYVRAKLTGPGEGMPFSENRFYSEFERTWKDESVAKATDLHPERLLSQGKKLLMVAGGKDKYWPAWKVVAAYAKRLSVYASNGQFTERIYPECGHFVGILPENMMSRIYIMRELLTREKDMKQGRLEMNESHIMVIRWLKQLIS
ncbi:MAG: hypothetical protein IJ719_14655 [Clostridia bacterium]|nr:hypothetical protein [Clostridia bacterium]